MKAPPVGALARLQKLGDVAISLSAACLSSLRRSRFRRKAWEKTWLPRVGNFHLQSSCLTVTISFTGAPPRTKNVAHAPYGVGAIQNRLTK